MLRWSSVRRRSVCWEQREQLQQQPFCTAGTAATAAAAPNSRSIDICDENGSVVGIRPGRASTVNAAGINSSHHRLPPPQQQQQHYPSSTYNNRPPPPGVRRFRRAMTTEVPNSNCGGGGSAVVEPPPGFMPNRQRPAAHSARRRRSLWAERYAQHWAQADGTTGTGTGSNHTTMSETDALGIGSQQSAEMVLLMDVGQQEEDGPCRPSIMTNNRISNRRRKPPLLLMGGGTRQNSLVASLVLDRQMSNAGNATAAGGTKALSKENSAAAINLVLQSPSSPPPPITRAATPAIMFSYGGGGGTGGGFVPSNRRESSRGGSLSMVSSPPLLAIDDDEAKTDEDGTEMDDERGAAMMSAHSELLPRVTKSRSRHSGGPMHHASFCDLAIQKDEEKLLLNGGTGTDLLRLPSTVEMASSGVGGGTAGGGMGDRRASILQSATDMIRRRRSSFARERWASKFEFLLAVIGYAVDLGNIWRFPSVCYKHGGGAFLIPYIVMLMVGGLPMFYMELVLGQFHRSGCLSIWKKICPMFKGIGYGICFICTFIACFYNAVIAHAVYFFISSVGWEVPWMRCNNTWNTKFCRESLNASFETAPDGEQLRTPSQEFYIRSVLQSDKSTGFDDLGGVKPSMAFCLFLVFLTVYFALWKGPRSTGKFVWVTATAPYLVLSILLIRGLTLPGAGKGIYYYLMPDFNKLLEPQVWTAAATQIFFSLGPGFGVLLALSSYNDFNNNCYRDAVVTSLINCFTSFFSGFVIFSTLGYMSELTNRPVSEVVGEGESSLIFVVYPQAIATMDYSSIWSLIFFLMLITLGIDSTFSGIEALITGFCDEYPRVLARKREIFVAFVIVMYYIGSLPTVTYGGQYVIPFLDEYGVSLSVLFIVVCEMIAVCWFYGITQFSQDIHTMLGFYPGLYWRVCWTCCPVFIGIIFILALWSTSLSPMEIPNYTYPAWSVPLGWVFRLLSCMSVPAYMLYMLCTTPGPILKRFKLMVTPQSRASFSTAHSTITLNNPNCGVGSIGGDRGIGSGGTTTNSLLLTNAAGTNNNNNSNGGVGHHNALMMMGGGGGGGRLRGGSSASAIISMYNNNNNCSSSRASRQSSITSSIAHL